MKGFVVAAASAIASALVSTAADRTYHALDTVAEAIVVPLDSRALQMTVEARCAAGRRDGSWGMSGDRWSVVLTPENEYNDIALPEMVVTLTVDGREAVARRMDRGFNFGRSAANSLAVTLRADSVIEIAAGGTALLPVAAVPVGFSPLHGECTVKAGRGNLKVIMAVSENVADPSAALLTGLSLEDVEARCRLSADPLEGIWTYFDRENDPARARPGGRYRIACLACGDGSYDLIYLGGAVVNVSKWRPGMRKGRLVPTPFEGHYDLIWVDAMMEPMENDVSATVADGLMTLNFPLLKSRLRFSRLPADN